MFDLAPRSRRWVHGPGRLRAIRGDRAKVCDRTEGKRVKRTGEEIERGAGRLDLAVVMPVYNERECIARVIESWLDVLSKEGMAFKLIVLDDGSDDGTAEELAAFEREPAVEVVRKANSGHGPTVLVGYARAVEVAEWVFQCDSDDEIKPDHFPALWRNRNQYDALFGVRSGRSQPLSRRIVSFFSNLTVRVLCGTGVEDANTPYRLMRSSILADILPHIPPDTFAPNVIISGALARSGARVLNHPVFWQERRTGRTSIARVKLLKSALRAFWQTLRCRPRVGSAADRPGEPPSGRTEGRG